MLLQSEMQAHAAVVDELIGWLHTTTTARVMDEAADKLAAGVAEDDLWAASVLTASHYVNNQAHNLMGFVAHSMVGCEDARRLAQGQPRRIRYLLLMQSLHQTVADLHDPSFAPYELLLFWPIHEPTPAESIEWLRRDVRMGEASRADHRLVGLNEHLTPQEIADLVLDIGLEGMVTDDHTLISPTLLLGMIDLVGWARGFELMRWAVRYSASFPRDFSAYDRSVILAQEFGLQGGAPVRDFQADRVLALRTRLLSAEPSARPHLVAHALAREACSPATIVAAAAQAACDMYLMVEPVPHADFDAISREVAPIHMGNCLRTMATALAYMSPRTQVLAALQAGSQLERGPMIIDADFNHSPFAPASAYPYADDVAALQGYCATDLLDYLREVVPCHDCRRVTAAVRAYANHGGDSETLITLLTEFACTDHGTLMHNIKHLNSMVIEFRRATFQQGSHPDHWNFLIQAAKFLTWYYGLTTDAYRRADTALERHCAWGNMG
ncbi:MAG: hypothetical protein IT328_19090 [Caldilineaceae bacterium]|nr:hypothetical protein [Caldilineaceae bacterium]